MNENTNNGHSLVRDITKEDLHTIQCALHLVQLFDYPEEVTDKILKPIDSIIGEYVPIGCTNEGNKTHLLMAMAPFSNLVFNLMPEEFYHPLQSLRDKSVSDKNSVTRDEVRGLVDQIKDADEKAFINILRPLIVLYIVNAIEHTGE
jgi:hypothetical protein